MLFFEKTYVLDIYQNRLAEAILKKTKKKRMIYKELLKNIRYSCSRRILLKFLYKSEFVFTAKSLVTNTVVTLYNEGPLYLVNERIGEDRQLMHIRILKIYSQ